VLGACSLMRSTLRARWLGDLRTCAGRRGELLKVSTSNGVSYCSLVHTHGYY
jgi:hypothetical protein